MPEFAQLSGSPARDGTKPPRPTAGYADLLAVRLRRLAAGQSTGMLPFSGRSDGAIYLHGGNIIGAESSRTSGLAAASPQASSSQAGLVPAPTPRAGHLVAAAAPQAWALRGAEVAGHSPNGRAAPTLSGAGPTRHGDQATRDGDDAEHPGNEVTGPRDDAEHAGNEVTGPGDDAKHLGDDAEHAGDEMTGPGDDANAGQPERDLLAELLRVEPAIDAVLDLVLSQSAIGRFRTGKGRSGPELVSLPADWLITEIARRLHLVRQMAVLVTADTTVSRSPRLHADRVQVSALQWALLIRAGTATTPRTLACALGRGVFGTTTEVYQLVALRLLSVADQVGGAADLRQRDALGPLEPCPGAISFLRAVSDEKGDHGMPKLSQVLHQVGGGR
jgi:hypothetical protein